MDSRPGFIRFKELIQREGRRLDGGDGFEPVIAEPGRADEPWVSFTHRDRLGLALSGGGIRSATFNLGFLQACHRIGLLAHVDYLSTVSGGGYIGGFWSAWVRQSGLDASVAERDRVFPRSENEAAADGSDPTTSSDAVSLIAPVARHAFRSDQREPPAFRHLRQFSRFLMPRVGFMQSETWTGVVALLAGLLPSLVGTGALLAFALYTWLLAATALVNLDDALGIVPKAGHLALPSALLLAVSTLSYQFVAEWRWRRLGKANHSDGGYSAFTVFAAASALIAAGGWLLLRRHAPSDLLFVFPAAAWIVASVGLLLLRGVSGRWATRKDALLWSSAVDRATSRCLAPAVVWAAVAGIWFLSERLIAFEGFRSAAAAGGGAVTFAALFAWLRDWLVKPVEETRGSNLMRALVRRLKPLAPQLAANGAVLCFLVVLALIIARYGRGERFFVGFGLCSILIGITAWLFDPARVGLHDFYRARISRGFLGAVRAAKDRAPRSASEHLDDDLALGQLRDNARPIHLVCCAANNLGGDVLTSLYRGARSAVLSGEGVSIGDVAARIDDLPLSSALTASAAAFNSQMGSFSMRFGPGVAFVMCALNLRLGLWVPHPLTQNRRHGWFPGLYFYLEMLGITDCDPDTGQPAPQGSYGRGLRRRRLHLSDGGHFENLGLYELVRRHCRYVIVSDCGADPALEFDDLANAVRLVREDFGVDIDIDVGPLRPDADGNCRQHAVIGTIHYDGISGLDKGVLLYVKPGLTGDEPPDLLQYRTKNEFFPQESTGDQFYDEAQWESYRRLGEHSASVVFHFRDGKESIPSMDKLFTEGMQHWSPAPPHHHEAILEVTERCRSLEADIRDNAPARLRDEFFPEVLAAQNQPSSVRPDEPEEDARTVYFLLSVAQTMEDAWLSAQLDTYWSHPLNEGWMNHFQRWASTPSFRRWWPVLRAMFSPGFRDFMRDRFDLRVADPRARVEPDVPHARLELASGPAGQAPKGLAWDQWVHRYGAPSLEGKRVFQYRLNLIGGGQPIQVGVLRYSVSMTDGGLVASWRSSDLFVPPPLVGGGIISRFLDALLVRFQTESIDPDDPESRVEKLSVTFAGEGSREGVSRVDRRDPASRRARIHTINFYKSRGFTYSRTDRQRLELDLRSSDSHVGVPSSSGAVTETPPAKSANEFFR